MKKYYQIVLVVLITSILGVIGCKKNTSSTPPEIQSLNILTTNPIYGDSIKVEGVIFCKNTALSTLNVEIKYADEVVFYNKIRTKENPYNLNSYITLPLVADLDNTIPITISFTSVNVNGDSVTEVRSLTATLPTMNSIWVQWYNTEDGIVNATIDQLTQSVTNTNEFTLSSSSVKNRIMAKFSNTADFSGIVWAWNSTTEKIEANSDGDFIPINNLDLATVTGMNFNKQTFLATLSGSAKLPYILNGTTLTADNALTTTSGKTCYKANLTFAQGATVAYSGFLQMATAYNPDYFTYSGGTLTFKSTVADGTYEVVYVEEANYLFMRKARTTSYPTCLYLTGGGIHLPTSTFTSSGWGNVFPWGDDAFGYYMPLIGTDKYEITVWLAADFNIKAFGTVGWGNEQKYADFGTVNATNVTTNSGGDWNADTGFVAGWYTITVDLTGTKTLTFTPKKALHP